MPNFAAYYCRKKKISCHIKAIAIFILKFALRCLLSNYFCCSHFMAVA